jgi:hypothetical protein
MSFAANESAATGISRGRAVLTIILGLTAGGALLGLLWVWLAPPVHGVVALTKSNQRVKAYLGNEGDHFFLAAFLIVAMVSALATVAAVLVWQWRRGRGPVAVAALALGGAAAMAAASGVGAVVAHWRFGTVDVAHAPVSPDHRVAYTVEAPAAFFGHTPLQVALTILFPAAIGALVYAVMAVSTDRDDLGAWSPADGPANLAPVTAESALPSAQ